MCAPLQYSLLQNVFDVGEHVDFISSFVWFNVNRHLRAEDANLPEYGALSYDEKIIFITIFWLSLKSPDIRYSIVCKKNI